MRVAEIDLEDLFTRWSSPLYLYDLDVLAADADQLRHAVRELNGEIYAFEGANRNPDVLRRLRDAGTGITVQSPAGVERARSLGFDIPEIECSEFGWTPEEVAHHARLGYTVNVSSIGELTQLSRTGERLTVGIRIASTNSFQEKAGIPPETLLQTVAAGLPIRIGGLQVYVGTNTSGADVHASACRCLCDCAIALADRGHSIEYLNMGGGFPFDYVGGHRFDWPEYMRLTRPLVDRASTALGKRLRIKFEFGRALLARSAVFATRILYAYEQKEARYLVVDANMSHFPRPARYGIPERSVGMEGHHRLRLASPIVGKTAVAYVVGNSWYSRDWFGSVEVPESDPERLVGSAVVFESAGAYCEAMADDWGDRPRARALVIRDSRDQARAASIAESQPHSIRSGDRSSSRRGP